ncbi:MAG: PhnD/SsuA/transferrin family substrate-binding protein [Bradymonadales bacterium]|nr:PhnD/SsuA/transferrin family substrate-binding protein [Bradymonadales bacterium]
MPPLTFFGLPPSLTPTREVELGKAFVKLLGETMQLPIQPVVAASYSELSDELAEGRIDFAWLPPLEASRLSEHCGIILLAQAVRAGQSHYFSVFFTRADSPIQKLEELEGKEIAFVHRRSASGYLVAVATLKQAGIAFAEPPIFAGSHAEVVRAVLEKRAEAGATFCTFEGEPSRGKMVEAGWTQALDTAEVPMRIIAIAGQVPSDVICAWPGTSFRLRQRLFGVLTELHRTQQSKKLVRDLFGADRFAEVDPKVFSPLTEKIERFAR